MYLTGRLPATGDSQGVTGARCGSTGEPKGSEGIVIDSLRRLVSDPDLHTHYAANARKSAKMLNWESQEQALLDLYESILHPKR